MRSAAYADYAQRMRESVALVHLACESANPLVASACSKGASVLAAAALERYLNDAIRQACQRIKVERWEDLAEGQQSYLTRQVAQRLHMASKKVLAKNPTSQRRRARFRALIRQCFDGFDNPSSWPHLPNFGMFMEGAAGPDRIERILRDFDPRGRSLYAQLDAKGRDRGAFLGALSQLVDSRHAAAHALATGPTPGPKDVQAWVVLSFWLVREIETYLAS